MPALPADIVERIRQPILVLDDDLRVVLVNRAFCERYGTTREEADGSPLNELCDGGWDNAELAEMLGAFRRGERDISDERMEEDFAGLGRRSLRLNATLMESGAHDGRILLAIDDETERDELIFQLGAEKEYVEKIVDAVRDSLLVLNTDLRVAAVNQTFCDKFGIAAEEARGRLVYELGDGEWDTPRLRELLEEVLPDNHSFDDFEIDQEFHGLGRRIMLLNARRLDHLQQILLAIEDVTDRREWAQRLRESERKYRTLFSSIDQGFCIIELLCDDDGEIVDYVIRDANESFRRQTGQDAPEGMRMRDIAPNHGESWLATFKRVQETGEAEHFEHQQDNDESHYECHAFRFDVPVPAMIGVLYNDISDRKRSEAERELLTRELSHRVKNTLAVVQSLAAQTARNADTIEEFRDVFLGRLQSLARAHGLLVDTHWRSVGLADLARQSVDVYLVDHPDLVRIEGEPVMLTPKQGLGVALILHELATNAAKYGALSRSEGRLGITWKTETGGEHPRVRLEWRERHGPKVQPPKKHGFGSRLIERAATYELRGSAELRFAPEGLTCMLEFPLELE